MEWRVTLVATAGKIHGVRRSRYFYTMNHVCRIALIVGVMFHATGLSAQNADISLLRHINGPRNKAMDGVMSAVSNSVYPVTLAAPGAELLVGYIKHDKRPQRDGWQTVAAIGINTILTSGTKYVVNRDRPYMTYHDIVPYKYDTDPSFPSGHTSYSFCTATSLSICFPKWYVIAPAYAWAGVAGYSRMYLGEHYPTDVLVGALVGSGSAWLAWKGNEWLRKRTSLRPSPKKGVE